MDRHPDHATRSKPVKGGRSPMGSRVIVTVGLALLYLVGCVAALILLAGIWN